jgi:hypothetical protein
MRGFLGLDAKREKKRERPLGPGSGARRMIGICRNRRCVYWLQSRSPGVPES